jgi:hypothetical protein
VFSLFWQCLVQYIPGLPKVRKPCMLRCQIRVLLGGPGLLGQALLLLSLILDLLIG